MSRDLTALEPLAARLAQTVEDVFELLEGTGRLRPGAERPHLTLPPSYASLIAWALEVERAEGTAESLERADRLVGTYGEWVPRLRVEQLATRDAPAEWLFHTPIAWDQTPRLTSALRRFEAACVAAEVPLPRSLGAATTEALFARRVTLAELFTETFFGGLMPMLYTWPGDLAAIAEELATGEPPWQVFDRRVTAPLIHELSHFDRGRDALLPPYADECVAGWIGVAIHPPLCWPAPGEDVGLFGAAWFAQVGAALARVVGLRPLLRAQAGVVPWDDVLPAGLRAAMVRLGEQLYLRHRAPHFLSGNTAPDPWMRLFFLAGAGADLTRLDLATLEATPWTDVPAGEVTPEDLDLLGDALRTMALVPAQVGGTYRVSLAPPAVPVTLDAAQCRVWRPADPGSPDLAAPSYLLPPAIAAHLRVAGIHSYRLALQDLDALDAVVALVADAAEGAEQGRFALTRAE